MTDKSGRNTSSGAVPARQDSTGESAWRPRAASLRWHLRSITHPVRGLAAFRIWVRRSEIALVALAILAGGVSGLVASLMGGATHWLHVMLFGPGAEYGLSAMRNAGPFLVFFVPIIGGLLLGLLNLGLARWWPRPPIDPIEANALYGGRLSLADGAVVGAQNIVSNGFGASVGLEAAYAQAGGGLASRLGEAFGLRRADLRVLVGCGAAGAIAAAFGAPVTGAFYAFELIIGSYTIANFVPVMASARAGSPLPGALGGGRALAPFRGIRAPGFSDYRLPVPVGVLRRA